MVLISNFGVCGANWRGVVLDSIKAFYTPYVVLKGVVLDGLKFNVNWSWFQSNFTSQNKKVVFLVLIGVDFSGSNAQCQLIPKMALIGAVYYLITFITTQEVPFWHLPVLCSGLQNTMQINTKNGVVWHWLPNIPKAMLFDIETGMSWSCGSDSLRPF